MVDGVALVLDSRHDKLGLLLRAKEMLSSLAHTPAGVILNRMPRRKRNSYFASATPSVSSAEKWVHVAAQASTSNGNGNGNGDISGYERKVENAPAINSPFPSMNGMNLPAKEAVPPVPPTVPMNDMAMSSQLSTYLPSPNAVTNTHPNPSSQRSLLHGVDISKPRNV
jgi:hypothetical protein